MVTEWLACWTQVQKGLGSNHSRDAVGNILGQTVHTHCASVHQAAKLAAALLSVARVIVGLAKSNGNGFMTHVTCRLTAKNRDQLQNHMLGNRIWASFTFLRYPQASGHSGETNDATCRLNPSRSQSHSLNEIDVY